MWINQREQNTSIITITVPRRRFKGTEQTHWGLTTSVVKRSGGPSAHAKIILLKHKRNSSKTVDLMYFDWFVGGGWEGGVKYYLITLILHCKTSLHECSDGPHRPHAPEVVRESSRRLKKTRASPEVNVCRTGIHASSKTIKRPGAHANFIDSLKQIVKW